MEGVKVVELIAEALAFGWPLLVLIVAVFLFKQSKVSVPAEKKNMMFNTMIGLLAAVLLLMLSSIIRVTLGPVMGNYQFRWS